MFSLVADRNVSGFLDAVSFVSLRRTCKTHYEDHDAWTIRVHGRHKKDSLKNVRETLALRYLLSWAARFPDPKWSVEWFQRVVDWLEYKVSIKLFHSLIIDRESNLLCKLNLCRVSSKQKIIWWKVHMACHNSRVYKRLRCESDVLWSRKRRRKCSDKGCLPYKRHAVPCVK